MGSDIVEYKNNEVTPGRKHTDEQVQDRRVALAKEMSSGTRYHDLVQWYLQTFGVGEDQLKKDRQAIKKEWRDMVFHEDMMDTLAGFIETIQESIKIASKSNQPSAMQQGVVLLNRILGEYHKSKNMIEDKDVTIKYTVIDGDTEEDI